MMYRGGLGYCTGRQCADGFGGNHVIPDASFPRRHFTRAETDASAAHKNWISSEPLDLVVEITGFNRLVDCVLKVRAYGRMGIPHYLLIDRSEQVVVLYSDPTGDVDESGYRGSRSFAFGERVQPPEPYPVLGTSDWQ